MHKAIRISANTTVVLDDEILETAGSITGTVHLQGMTNHTKSVILLTGTNTYTTPFDSVGGFSFPSLATGTYNLKALSTELSLIHI
jgi:hypothetical protein